MERFRELGNRLKKLCGDYTHGTFIVGLTVVLGLWGSEYGHRGLEQIPERWRPRLRNFLIYILPVIVGETIRGMLKGDMGMASGMLPALAMWGLTGRIQAVPITWLVLLIGEPALVLLIGEPALAQFDGVRGAIWILTAIGVGTGIVRIGRWKLLSKKDQEKREPKSPPRCEPCEKEVRPVRPKVSIGWLALCIALAVVPGYLWGWALTLPLLIFAISRLAKEAICPDCRQHIPGAKVPFDTEAVVMTGLIVLCIGGAIGSQIINHINQPNAECATALETVKEGGGPDLWTMSEADLDRWLEEDPYGWEILENVGSACWEEREDETGKRSPSFPPLSKIDSAENRPPMDQ